MITFVFSKLANIYRKLIKRPINQRHRYDFPSENNGWSKYGNVPIWGNPKIGTMFDPYSYTEAGKIKMVVSDRKRRTLILIESIDGIIWAKQSDLLMGVEHAWDNDVNRGCLLYYNNQYYLWYTGQNMGKSAIGLAISNDGKSFKRVTDRPIMVADKLYEGAGIMNPCVIWDNESQIFKMWYSAGDIYEPDVICYAESFNGVTWNKHTKPVLEKHPCHLWEKYKVGGCCVIKQVNSYTMYYIGYQNVDVARICFAHSQDGINWFRDENNILISPSRGSWDSDATYKPTVVEIGGKLYLWYNGRKGHEEYIGLAIKE